MRKNENPDKTPVEVLRKKQASKHILSKNTPQVHSRKKPAPEKLAWLIEMVNLIPDDSLARWTSQSLATYARNKNEDSNQLMKQVIERLPKKLRDFVGEYPEKEDDIERCIVGRMDLTGPALIQHQFDACERYDFLVVARDLLHNIANWGSPVGVRLKALLPHELTIDDNGRLALKPAPLTEHLLGVEVRRVRECPICEHIFWAERMDQPACSKRCNNIRRSRIQRGTYRPRMADTYGAHRKDSRIHELFSKEDGK